jgi:hypothetical protein
MARPTKLTPEIQAAIVARVEAGNYPEYAVESVGISASTYYSWMRKGKKAKSGPFLQFSKAVKKAKATEQIENVLHIKQAMKGGKLIERTTITKKDGTTQTTEKYSQGIWQAASWLLERKYPHLWALREAKRNAETQDRVAELEKKLNALLEQRESPPPSGPCPYQPPTEPAA